MAVSIASFNTLSALAPDGASLKPVPVGLGEVRVTQIGRGEELVAHGLGSCVALCVFDPLTGIAGMAHVVLPGANPHGVPHAKFAESALLAVLREMEEIGRGRDPRRLLVTLAGGAHVLVLGGSGTLPRIGERNAEGVRASVSVARMRVRAEELGGNRGRTVWFDPRAEGRVRVRTVGSETRLL